MNLLFVSLDFPFPATNGHRMRNWSLLRALAAEGHDVSLLTFVQGDAPSPSAFQKVKEVSSEIVTVPLELPKAAAGRNYLAATAGLFSPIPYGVSRFRSAAMSSCLSLLLASGRFDAVMCETCYSLVNFPPVCNIPLILDNHNLEHVLVRRYCRFESSPARRAYAEIEWRKMRRWERAGWSRASRVILCSAHDRALCRSIAGELSASVVPNIVDIGQYSPRHQGDGATVLYVGGMDWFPNRDAVQWFALQVLPDLRRHFPDVRFVVGGRSPAPEFRAAIEKAGVSFTGTVPDMRPVIAAADICVVPLRIGSGTRLKILEAAAMEKAIVSTTVGAEGLDLVDGSEIQIADAPADFAQAVLRLLRDPARRSSQGTRARRRIAADYSLESMRQAVSAALAGLGAATRQCPTGTRKEALWPSSIC